MKRRAPDKSSYFVSSLVPVYRTGYGLVACDWSQFIRLARRLGASGSHESARVNDHHLRGIARLLVFVIHPLTLLREFFRTWTRVRLRVTIKLFFSEPERDRPIERINSLDRVSNGEFSFDLYRRESITKFTKKKRKGDHRWKRKSSNFYGR